MIIITDDTDQALNEAEIDNSSEATPATEETTEEVAESQVEADSTDEAEAESEGAETGGSSEKGFESRKSQLNTEIRELVDKRNKTREEVQSLQDKIAELTGRDSQDIPNIPVLPDEPLIKPGEEIDGAELDKRLREREQKIIQRADSISQLRNKQQEAMSRIERETDQVMKKYPELDPDDEKFDQELSDTVAEAVQAHIKSDPYSASVLEFTERLMKPYNRAVTKRVGKATENIAKQASKAALKPTQTRKQEKDASEKSIAELEQELGIVQS